MNTRFETPDIILYNGTIFTADETDSICSALAVCGNEIIATGESDEILGLAAPWTKLIDLKGRSAMPGINDCHSHLWQAGQTFQGVVLFGIDSFDMLKEKLAEKAAVTPAGKWIAGCSYIESQFKENRSFTKAELDEAAPYHPVVFDRVF
ncbi:MAG: amidohydrolase family protein, partial [Firmicutes bacterium]|nr:amidohydrolase family protein [Bacillota bacterium]